MTNSGDIEPKDHSKYRLIGNSVLSYRFIVPHDAVVYVGDIKKIRDTIKHYTFFAKVCDLVHASNFSDERWDTRPYGEEFYGLSEDVFLEVEAVPLGFIDEAGKFRKPRTLPAKFSPVEEPGGEDFQFLRDLMGEIEVGLMRTGQGALEDVRVKIPADILPQHMGVFATTGMGKSNFMKVFCASCMKERKFGLLIIDPHGEYVEGGGRSPKGEKKYGLVHYSEGKKDGLSIFTIRSEPDRKKYGMNRLYLAWDDFRMEDLNVLYEDISSPQRDIIEALEEFSGGDVIRFFAGVDPESFTETSYISMGGKDKDIAYKIRTSKGGPIRVLKRRLDNLVGRNREFFRENGSSVPEILSRLHENRVVLIDIPRMGERSELFVLSVITRKIMDLHQEKSKEFGLCEGEKGPGKVLITIEEAQRVLGAGGASTRTFRECAMEGRKFGVGLCVITQQPKNIDARVLAQINTFVVMGLGDRSDRDIIAGSAKQDLSRMDTEIQTLDRGEAIISTIGIPFPVSTRIHLFEDYVDELNLQHRPSAYDGLDTGF